LISKTPPPDRVFLFPVSSGLDNTPSSNRSVPSPFSFCCRRIFLPDLSSPTGSLKKSSGYRRNSLFFGHRFFFSPSEPLSLLGIRHTLLPTRSVSLRRFPFARRSFPRPAVNMVQALCLRNRRFAWSSARVFSFSSSAPKHLSPHPLRELARNQACRFLTKKRGPLFISRGSQIFFFPSDIGGISSLLANGQGTCKILPA